MGITLILLSDIKFGTCRGCFCYAVWTRYGARLNLVYIMAPGNVSASEQVFLPYKQYLFTSIFVNREVAIIQVKGCLVCGVAAGGSDTFQMVAARLVEVCLSCL